MSPPPTANHTSASSRWLALATRSPSAHSLFVYSVVTTRIYCRPTCPSRLARRANVIFYDTAADAAAAGFRPCKRCKPEVEGWEAGGEVVERAKKMIREGKRGVVGLSKLSKGVGLSRSHFLRVFKGVVGCTPREWAESEGRRLEDEQVDSQKVESAMQTDTTESSADLPEAVPDEYVDFELRSLGFDPTEADMSLFDVPYDVCSFRNEESSITTSDNELWDLYFEYHSLPTEIAFPPESESLLPPGIGTPLDMEPLTPLSFLIPLEYEGLTMKHGANQSDEWPCLAPRPDQFLRFDGGIAETDL